MISLVFSINREVFRITIDKKRIWYLDRKWKKSIRLIPKDEDFLRKISMSRNTIPNSLISLFNFTEEEKVQYDNAKTDDELAKVIIKDCRMKGGQLLKKEVKDG